MKTGEEKFDDALRNKLESARELPPENFFENILPEKKKRRGSLWFLPAGILILLSVSGYLLFEMNHADKYNAEQIVEDVNMSNGRNANDPVQPSSDIVGSTTTNTVSENNETEVVDGKQAEEQNNRERILTNENKSSINRAISVKTHGMKSQINASTNLGDEKESKRDISPGVTENTFLIYSPILSLNQTDLIQGVKVMNPTTAEFKDHKPSRFMVDIHGGILTGDIQLAANTTDSAARRLLDERIRLNETIKGFTAGARLHYKFSNHVSISAGIDYSSRKENFEFDIAQYYKVLKVETHTYYILFPFSAPMQVTDYDSSIVTQSKQHHIKHAIKISTVNLAADVYYHVPLGNFVVSSYTGINYVMHTATGGETNFHSDFATTNTDHIIRKSMRIGIKGGVQLGYGISERISVFTGAEYQHYLQPLTRKYLFYEEKANPIAIMAGVKYHFFNKEAADGK